MAKSSTFTINRAELRRILVAFGMNDKNIANIFSTMDKAHKHINVIAFASMLEKTGFDRDKMANVFRRLGMDDITISNVFSLVDEQRITAETGRIYSATLDFS